MSDKERLQERMRRFSREMAEDVDRALLGGALPPNAPQRHGQANPWTRRSGPGDMEFYVAQWRRFRFAREDFLRLKVWENTTDGLFAPRRLVVAMTLLCADVGGGAPSWLETPRSYALDELDQRYADGPQAFYTWQECELERMFVSTVKHEFDEQLRFDGIPARPNPHGLGLLKGMK